MLTSTTPQETTDKKEEIQSLPGLTIQRVFTQEGVHPFDEIEWSLRSAVIRGPEGSLVFEQRNVEAPKNWSDTAVNIVASKYFRGLMDTPERETSVKQLINRVVDRISSWGEEEKYFATIKDVQTFKDELTHMLVNQMVAFNSPVWFNLGVKGARQQASACYINSVDDSMESIMELATTEAMIFKWGSGAGVNLSKLRSSKEHLSGGGKSSGPVSFMKGYDAFSGVIKSGGKLRRSAKIICLNDDHPDIVEFIECKVSEERKAHALINAGYDSAIDGEAYSSIFFQNSNNSVRLSDEFMKTLEEDGDWGLKAVTTGETLETVKAKSIMDKICQSAWECGDPGVQFDTTINDWHMCPESGRINASNPCNEYAFLDNTACNLASFNLMKYADTVGNFRIEDFCHSVDVMITAMEIIVGKADYPTPEITSRSYKYRTLGLGYTNLGTLLMTKGLPYDSSPGRAYAAALTALMNSRAYRQSSVISRDSTGPFSEYDRNKKHVQKILQKHHEAIKDIDNALVPVDLMQAVKSNSIDMVTLGASHGVRNAQATVLAPTGTISFLLDCDTTGVEPAIALVSYKSLVGGGHLKLVNHQVPVALRRLKYTEEEVKEICSYIENNDTIEGAPHLKEAHLPVFDCAFKAASGTRFISPMGHVRMMAAVQPFISGAISKTTNVPNSATPEDIRDIYTQAWKLGIKAIAVYRDGCKRSQPLSTSKEAEVLPSSPPQSTRNKLDDTRRSLTHKFEIGGHKGYLTVGYYESGDPGEIFIRMAKEGSTISGLMDSLATAVSLGLQHGIPLDSFVKKFSHSSFEPHGWTSNPKIGHASSVVDYIFRWLSLNHEEAKEAIAVAPRSVSTSMGFTDSDAPPCVTCGNIMVRNGNCHSCKSCGSTSGCG